MSLNKSMIKLVNLIIILVLSRKGSVVFADTKCIEELGCFSNEDPYTSPYLPQDRDQINVQFMLHTRQNPDTESEQYLIAGNKESILNSFFNIRRKTKFLIHGFISTGWDQWMLDTTQELLVHGDYNVIRVDWSNGAKQLYGQAVANTQVTAAEISLLVTFMREEFGLDEMMVHLIGHSLGAHTAGYAGHRLSNLGRISGLDPAGPYFSNSDPLMRLDPTDANFVDAIHADSESIFQAGFGMYNPVGNVDFYPNGGYDQPGCTGLDNEICDHSRGHQLFTDSINSHREFLAWPCTDYDHFQNGECLSCTADVGCGFMGLNADKLRPPGDAINVKYWLQTSDAAPYARDHYQFVLSLGSHEEAKPVQSKLYLKIIGEIGETIEIEMTQSGSSLIDLEPNTSYTFLITTDINVGGRITGVHFEWDYEGAWWKPWEWEIFKDPTIWLNSISINKGDTDEKYEFGYNGNALKTNRKIILSNPVMRNIITRRQRFNDKNEGYSN